MFIKSHGEDKKFGLCKTFILSNFILNALSERYDITESKFMLHKFYKLPIYKSNVFSTTPGSSV